MQTSTTSVIPTDLEALSLDDLMAAYCANLDARVNRFTTLAQMEVLDADHARLRAEVLRRTPVRKLEPPLPVSLDWT